MSLGFRSLGFGMRGLGSILISCNLVAYATVFCGPDLASPLLPDTLGFWASGLSVGHLSYCLKLLKAVI